MNLSDILLRASKGGSWASMAFWNILVFHLLWPAFYEYDDLCLIEMDDEPGYTPYMIFFCFSLGLSDI